MISLIDILKKALEQVNYITMTPIKEFQAKNGLVADGIIGKMTANKMMEVFNIKNKIHLAHFLGQTHHETGGFDRSSAKLYANNPKRIASRVYANRYGNGDETTKDGWKYRGRGSIQTTFKANYESLGSNLKDMSILEHPDKVAYQYFWEAGLVYFNQRGIWSDCTDITVATIQKVTRKINGGTNGLTDRINQTNKYYNLLK